MSFRPLRPPNKFQDPPTNFWGIFLVLLAGLPMVEESVARMEKELESMEVAGDDDME